MAFPLPGRGDLQSDIILARWPALNLDGEIWPPIANELADPKLNMRSLTNARELRAKGEDKANPFLGDAIVFPGNGEERGHVGLYLGYNTIVSAKESGVEIGTVDHEQKVHGNRAMIRKFNGSGR